MEFNDTIINATRWFAPTWDPNFFMPTTPAPALLPNPPDPGYQHISAGKGRILIAVSKGGLPPTAPWGHDGKIAIIEFKITAVPTNPGEKYSTTLKIDTSDTYLLDNSASEIPGVTKQNGYYEISKLEGTFALTITSTSGGYTNPPVGTHVYPEGSIASVLAINYSGYEFGHWELDGVYSGSLNPINVTMDANHILRAVFKAVGNEGDVNGDGNVDLKDAFALAVSFGSHGPDYEYPGSPPSSSWKQECDLNADNKVELADLFIVFRNYGKEYKL
jgi:hypothetical protein